MLHWIFSDHRMLIGTTSFYMAGTVTVQEDQEEAVDTSNEKYKEEDSGPIPGDLTSALFVVNLAAKFHACLTQSLQH